MVRSLYLALLVALCLIEEISADWCYNSFSSYYCYPGQSCGSYYGDCRGLPTYAIVAIVSSGIVLLSVCIRCCIHLNAPNARPVAQRMPVSLQNPRHGPVPIRPYRNNFAGQPVTGVPVHNIREDAPPAYASVVSETAPPVKY